MFLITFMELPSHSFVVAAVQEQRPNVGTTRTLILQDNAASCKAEQLGPSFGIFREKRYRPYVLHPRYSQISAMWIFASLFLSLFFFLFSSSFVVVVENWPCRGKSVLLLVLFLFVFRIQDRARAMHSQRYAITSLENHNVFQIWLRRLQFCMDSKEFLFVCLFSFLFSI